MLRKRRKWRGAGGVETGLGSGHCTLDITHGLDRMGHRACPATTTEPRAQSPRGPFSRLGTKGTWSNRTGRGCGVTSWEHGAACGANWLVAMRAQSSIGSSDFTIAHFGMCTAS